MAKRAGKTNKTIMLHTGFIHLQYTEGVLDDI